MVCLDGNCPSGIKSKQSSEHHLGYRCSRIVEGKEGEGEKGKEKRESGGGQKWEAKFLTF